MTTRFWARDVADWWPASKELWGYDGAVWRRAWQAWTYDEGSAEWRQGYRAATLSNLLVTRTACTTTADHYITWLASGEMTGYTWTITIERKIGAGNFVTIAQFIDPLDGAYTATYAGGNSQTDYGFRVNLVHDTSVQAFTSPRTYGPPINPC